MAHEYTPDDRWTIDCEGTDREGFVLESGSFSAAVWYDRSNAADVESSWICGLYHEPDHDLIDKQPVDSRDVGMEIGEMFVFALTDRKDVYAIEREITNR